MPRNTSISKAGYGGNLGMMLQGQGQDEDYATALAEREAQHRMAALMFQMQGKVLEARAHIQQANIAAEAQRHAANMRYAGDRTKADTDRYTVDKTTGVQREQTQAVKSTADSKSLADFKANADKTALGYHTNLANMLGAAAKLMGDMKLAPGVQEQIYHTVRQSLTKQNKGKEPDPRDVTRAVQEAIARQTQNPVVDQLLRLAGEGQGPTGMQSFMQPRQQQGQQPGMGSFMAGQPQGGAIPQGGQTDDFDQYLMERLRAAGVKPMNMRHAMANYKQGGFENVFPQTAENYENARRGFLGLSTAKPTDQQTFIEYPNMSPEQRAEIIRTKGAGLDPISYHQVMNDMPRGTVYERRNGQFFVRDPRSGASIPVDNAMTSAHPDFPRPPAPVPPPPPPPPREYKNPLPPISEFPESAMFEGYKIPYPDIQIPRHIGSTEQPQWTGPGWQPDPRMPLPQDMPRQPQREADISDFLRRLGLWDSANV